MSREKQKATVIDGPTLSRRLGVGYPTLARWVQQRIVRARRMRYGSGAYRHVWTHQSVWEATGAAQLYRAKVPLSIASRCLQQVRSTGRTICAILDTGANKQPEIRAVDQVQATKLLEDGAPCLIVSFGDMDAATTN